MKNRVKINLAVIFGGRSGEHEVSIMSATSVLSAIDRQKYNVVEIVISKDGAWYAGLDMVDAAKDQDFSDKQRVTIIPDPSKSGVLAINDQDIESRGVYAELDVIFPLLHGTFGEDGTIQGLLELSDCAYIGPGVVGAAVGMDKGIFKDVMRANDIPVVAGFIASRNDIQENIESVINKSERVSDYPLFIKPANLGSSVGVSKCTSRSDLYEGLIDASRYDRRVLIERGINAREIEVSVLGNNEPIASVPGEIIPEADFYSYKAKYQDDRSKIIIPAVLSEAQTQTIRQLAVKAYLAMDCSGMARVDFLLDKDNDRLYLNEANTIPGFTKISMYPKLWEASGIPYPQLIDRLVEFALERRLEKKSTVWSFNPQDS